MIDLRSFLFNAVGVCSYQFPSKHCFCLTPWCWSVFVFIWFLVSRECLSSARLCFFPACEQSSFLGCEAPFKARIPLASRSPPGGAACGRGHADDRPLVPCSPRDLAESLGAHFPEADAPSRPAMHPSSGRFCPGRAVRTHPCPSRGGVWAA